MIWIHGGGFKFGDGSEVIYGPDFLLSKDIVYVSMNYRLGVLGRLYIRFKKCQQPYYTIYFASRILKY